MARYETVIHSTMSQQDAFDYMSAMENFEEWDPGINSSKQVSGAEPGVGATYEIEMSAMTLNYETTEFSRPNSVSFEAHSTLLSSFDRVEVTETATGCDVRYVADIELSGPLKLIDPLFGLVFNRIGDKAAKGMKDALKGTIK